MSTKYKVIIGVCSVALLAAGCSSQNNPAPDLSNQTQQNPSPDNAQSSPPTNPAPNTIPNTTLTPPAITTVTCSATEHSCPCATGNYCVFRGAMCISPTSACPVSKPTPAPEPTPIPTPSPTQPDSVGITISKFTFSPANVTVKKGTKVTWTNQDSAAHTVTGDTLSTSSGSTNGGPASGNISNGSSYSFTFNQTGTFPYHCSIHPSMTASITVTQ